MTTGLFGNFFAPVTYRVLIGRHDGKTPILRSCRRWNDNIKIDL